MECRWLDHSLFHLDGSQCLAHLDLLLGIKELKAIEWTPDPSVPTGGDPYWYPLYRKIIRAGKSVQAVGIKPAEVVPLLENVAPQGLYLLVDGCDAEGFQKLEKQVQHFR